MLLLKNICLGFLLFSLLMTAYLVGSGIALVEVNADDTHLWIPVPLAIGHLAGKLVNVPIERHPAWKRAMEYREEFSALLRQLKEIDKAELVEVKNPKEHVRIYKQADALYISIQSAQEKVLVRIPVQAMENLAKVFQSSKVTIGDLVACLEWQKSGDLVFVENGKERVRISLM